MKPAPDHDPHPAGARPAPTGLATPAGSVLAPRPRPLELSPKPTPIELLKVLRRRWMLAASLGLFCTLIAAAGVWFLQPIPKQAVNARLEVAANRPKIMFNTVEAQPDFAIYQRTQVALIKSQRVLDAVLKVSEVAKSASSASSLTRSAGTCRNAGTPVNAAVPCIETRTRRGTSLLATPSPDGASGG